eukprot:TRINITY_DN6391_c0_g1_i3.p1 TRINITY_DN6391_c0_g1~~TRINITY_DN6391_c0_g1_i3.p1  ORF type:complete len:213 (+),score=33.04 TRINITY_DN6391_c0_g1_i3:83-640(+)
MKDSLWETKVPTTKKLIIRNREFHIYMTEKNGLLFVVITESIINGKPGLLSGLGLAKVGWLFQQMENKFVGTYGKIENRDKTAEVVRKEFEPVIDDLLLDLEKFEDISDFGDEKQDIYDEASVPPPPGPPDPLPPPPLPFQVQIPHIRPPSPKDQSLPTPPPLTGQIGRAVQQECRDRSRMPSSA